jgi:hypothetical protein
MEFNQLIDPIEIWDQWRNNYKDYVPLFISEASNKLTWQEWDKDVFREFFEQSNDQCVSSLKLRYFTRSEKEEIKKNWHELALLLKRIADSQDIALYEDYQQIKDTIRKYTSQNRKAATNRLIAGLQPNLLCTIVNEENLAKFISLLNNNIDGCNLTATGNWFRNSNTVWEYYKGQKPGSSPYDLMTLPWQTYETLLYTSSNNNEMSENSELTENVELLKYKKQIILQGPPGTGKTHLAKKLAAAMINISTINNTDILNTIKAGIKINSSYDKLVYKVQEIVGETIRIVNSENSLVPTTFEKVKDAFVKKVWQGDRIKSEGDSYSAAVARYIHDTLSAEQVKIIQFHPSYTYEDFVRGIVAESKGEKIEYRNVNKILGKFAEEASLNWENSKKDSIEISKEHKLEEYFDLFVDFLTDELILKEQVFLTNKVYLIDRQEDAFRYRGNTGWTELGNRMLFKDIKRAFLDGNMTRQDVRLNKKLSGLANQHATYYLKVLNMFREYTSKNNLNFDQLSTERVELKNYVIIIDEINRANLPAVLGELIYALEYRGENVECVYDIEGNNQLLLPPNLYIIGTMNNADRSVAHIDYAIRRRFAFVDVFPKDLSEDLGPKFHKVLFDKVSGIFSTHLSQEFEENDVKLGHSYFIDKSEEGGSIAMRLKYEIQPILREYVKDGILQASALEIINSL